jgi:predicted acyl esterase
VRNGTEYKYLELGKVNYHSVCGDYWTTDTPSDKSMKLYINSNGTLSDSPRAEGQLSYVYDPNKPLNYYKYDNIFKCPPKHSTDGVLSFESEPAAEDTHFYGRIRWNMKVKSDCEDTAFFMRVYFVEDGVAYNLTETITSLSNINPDYRAGEECLISIFTAPVGFTLKAGNAIRVDISSHSDLYTHHSTTREHWAMRIDVKIAENMVICDEDAYITLPLEGQGAC